MADVTVTAAQVSIGEQAIVRTFLAGAAVTAGDAVYLDSAGKVQRVDADALASSQGFGVVVAVGVDGQTTAAANQAVSVCVWGPVYVGESANMTIPGRIYSSTTAGKFDQTAPAGGGDYPFILGYAVEADMVWVNPQSAIPTVNL